jgi:hypothetical protein
MSEQQTKTDDEISPVVRMLAERMESDPDDFVRAGDLVGGIGAIPSWGPKFSSLYDAVKRISADKAERGDKVGILKGTATLWYLNAAEIDLLTESVRAMSRRMFEKGILEKLYSPDPNPTDFLVDTTAQVRMQTTASALTASIANGATMLNSVEEKMRFIQSQYASQYAHPYTGTQTKEST